jgi:hypothetical protein
MPSTDVGSEVFRNRALNCYCGGMPHYGDELAVAPRLDPNDAKAVLGVLVGDALDQPRQHLSIGWMGLRLHDSRRLALYCSTG